MNADPTDHLLTQSTASEDAGADGAKNVPPSDSAQRADANAQPTGDREQRGEQGGAPRTATVLVRGEAINDADPTGKSGMSGKTDKEKPPKAISQEKVAAQGRLPALDDDGDVGVDKPHTVTRDGEADLAFTGTLIASAAPANAPTGEWQEYRIYETDGGKHIFSKVTRKIFVEEQDTHQAKIFDPAPTSTAAKLLKTAHDITHTRPLMWTDAAVDFFGYDPLAKDLYKKFGTLFEEGVG